MGGQSSYLDVSGRNTSLWPLFTFRFRRRTSNLAGGDHRLTPATAPEPEPLVVA